MWGFKKLNTKSYQKGSSNVTPENKYWKQLGEPLLIKEFGPIDYIDFSPIEPHYFAVTCSVRIQVYNPITKLVTKNLSRFRENAYGGSFRSDGKLLCAGGEESNVKLFDVTSKSLLRLFKGHTAPVHRTYFVNEKPQIASFSDDKTVKVWDIATEKEVVCYNEHKDYVRAGAVCGAIPDIVLSGGYDNVVKMYDTRSNSVVLEVDHGSPIESLLFLPSGSMFLSAGGTDIKIWDSVSGGKLIGSISQHHKTITCMALSTDNKRLLSGSLDRHVKVYDVSSFKNVHTLDYPSAVLSLGVSKNDDTVVVGLLDGLVCVSRREDKQIKKQEEPKRVVSYKYSVHPTSVVQAVPGVQHQKASNVDKMLRRFQFSRCVDEVTRPYICRVHPEITTALFKELIKRRVLNQALAGRHPDSLLQILRFFQRTITDLRFSRIIIDSFNIFLDCYEDKIHEMSAEIQNAVKTLLEILQAEIDLSYELTSLQGSLDMLLTSSSVANQQTSLSTRPLSLTPSASAKKNFVVTIH